MNDKLYTHCLRCGRRLKNEEYRKQGYGKICLEKITKDTRKKLFQIYGKNEVNNNE